MSDAFIKPVAVFKFISCTYSENMEKYDWVSNIKVNLMVFRIVGLWPKGKNYELNLYLLHAIIISGTFGVLHCACRTWKLLTNLNDLEVVAGTAFLSVSESLVVVKMFCLARNIKTFKGLLPMLDNDLFQPRNVNQIDLVTPSLNTWKFMNNLLGVIVTVAVSSYAVAPLLTGSAKKHQLPLLASYPYDATITPFFEITYLHQVGSIFILGICDANMDTFVAAFSLYAGNQLDILCDNLKNIRPGEFKKELVFCVKSYGQIVRYGKKCITFLKPLLFCSFVEAYNEAFNWMIFVQFFTSTVSLALTMFLMTTVSSFCLLILNHF